MTHAPPPTISDPRAVTPAIRRAAMTAAVLSTSMTFLDATALHQALPAIGQSLNASPAALMWMIGGYAIPVMLLLLPAGVLVDRAGRRGTLAAGIAVFSVASILCATAGSAAGLIVMRVLQGIGGAMMVPGSLALLSSVYEPHERGRAIGAWSAWTALATVLGPLLGGLLAQAGHWRMIFLLNVPLAAIALLLIRVAPATAVVNDMGAARALRRMLPATLWQRGTMRAAAGATLLLYTAFNGLMLFLPVGLISGAGYRADQAGAAQMPLVVMLVAVCPLVGRWVDRAGPRAATCAGCGAAATAVAWLAIGGFGSGTGDYVWRLLAPLALLGAGLGCAIVPLSTTMMNGVGERALGSGAAVNALLARLAAVVAFAIYGGLLLCRGVDLKPAMSATDPLWAATFQLAAAVTAVICTAAAIVALVLPTRAGSGTLDAAIVEVRP